jgi:predicted AlkP superfamily phosphohydrolase/phosphomutase
VEFDPETYDAWQEGARFAPWWAGLDRRVVVFDAPYVSLDRAPNTRGVVAWGAHDPGVDFAASPRELLPEFEALFGVYPTPEWTYGMPFPSPSRTRAMGADLSRALEIRTRAARWLATERLSDWDLFIAVSGEAHGAIEGLWHGVDPSHPFHAHPAGEAAGYALVEIHRALDRMVGDLVSAAGDAAIVAFAMGGMGPNHSDVPSMVLLPELLYRHAFGEPLLTLPAEWTASPGSLPLLGEDVGWGRANRTWVPEPPAAPEPGLSSGVRSLARRLPGPVRNGLRRIRAAARGGGNGGAPKRRLGLHWQPALRYRRHWPKMPAFALPSFYDGRIRLNLKGRERHGVVDPSRYEETCRELEALLRECRNPRTGEPAVESFERASTSDPLSLTATEADLQVIWRGVAAALEHPRLGVVGPVPLRRTGGHTGPHGIAYVAAPGVEAGDRGIRSSFDVVPTLVRLLAAEPPARLSGTSLL